jgi:ATP-dependent helicase/nuclease subunit A
VPFVVERETAFYQRREVIDALAWIRCVLDPHDQLALVTTLRSATVGVPDAGLVALLKHCPLGLIARIGVDADALARARGQIALAAREAPRGVPGWEALAQWPASALRFFEDLAALREAFATLPADRFVEALRTRSGIEATEAGRRLGAHRVATLDRIFRDLAEWTEELHGSPSLLLAALRRSGGEAREQEEGRPTSLADDAVRVLTVHKAKGLDFKHVYLLQLHRGDGGNPDPKPTRVWRRWDESEYQLLGLATPGAWRAIERGRVREAEERIRLLYVAMTRAKDRLVLSWCPEEPGEDGPPAPTRVSTIGGLFLHRAGRPALEALEGGELGDAHGVRWLHLDRDADGEPERVAPIQTSDSSEAPDVAADEAALGAARREAEHREARPVQRVASELTHDDEADAARSLPDEDAPEPLRALPDRERRIAMAAGTAVHAALEHADFADDADALTQHGARAIAAALASCEPAGERAAAEQRARAIWQRVCAGPLLARLRALAPRILARELPVLLAPSELPPSDDAPVGFVSGAIDLLYEDERGEVVVADYKTDVVSGDADLREKTAHYAGQGAAYTRAVQLALGLSAQPKFELWFLQVGERITID